MTLHNIPQNTEQPNEGTVTILINSPPFSHIDGKEGVDLALVCAAFDQTVNLVFVDEGIFHLINTQDDDSFLDKLHDKQLKALEYYDISSVFVESESMEKYSINQSSLLETVDVVSQSDIKQFCNNSQHTVIF